MKWGNLLLILLLFVSGCATHTAYDTARMRQREYRTEIITLNPDGLSRQQIQTITSTKPPAEFPIDVSLIFLKDGYISNTLEQMFVSNVINELKNSSRIDRIVPVPSFLIPGDINFPVIQELGIRTLSEYVMVFVLDDETFFDYTKILETQYKLTSAADFILIDSQTTAILASDRLFSEITYDQNIFKIGEREKAEKEIFTEQGSVMGKKISELFPE